MRTNKVDGVLDLGMIVITDGVKALLDDKDFCTLVLTSIPRHYQGDWGDVNKEDWESNQKSLENKGMLLSAYCSSDKATEIWIITDPGHKTTTVLLPSEY